MGERKIARTVREIPVYGRSEADVWSAVNAWAASYGGVVTGGPQPGGSRALVQMGVGAWQATRLFDISFRAIPGGTLVRTEGFVKGFMEEMDLNPGAFSGALPRREGWQAISDLWSRLGALSGSPSGAAVAVAAPPGAGPRFCVRCGTPLAGAMRFCAGCGAPTGRG